MSVLRCLLMFAVAAMLAPALATAQVNLGAYQAPIYQAPVYQAPVYQVPSCQPKILAPPAIATPNSICGCDPASPGDCKCKNLHCKISLPCCKSSTPPRKIKIPCQIFGKIPKLTVKTNCAAKVCDFTDSTDVPVIHCATECCTEIGTKALQCLGCWFNVCVPVNECTSETVECKLVAKAMPMELWQRSKNGQPVYDVYVINNSDPQSPFHAGGMPAKWLVLHCGSKEDVKDRFPTAIRADGTPLVEAEKDATPKATPADVNIEMVTDIEKIQEYENQAKAMAKKIVTKG